MTSVDTPNSFAAGLTAVLKMLLANVTTHVNKPKEIVIIHFFRFGQFMGLSGSSGPSQPTILLFASCLVVIA
jgi:hypothetical protein